jgi:primosomal protein N' (replication factor Y) (superfamily II helicase)
VSQLKFGNIEDEENQARYRAVYTDIILPIATGQLYTYRVPTPYVDSVKPGQRVAVQFGKKKIYTGIVAVVHETPPKDYTAKFLLEILDTEPIVGEKQLDLWKWVAEYYCCTMGDVMDAALPSFMKMKSETSILLHPDYKNSSFELGEKELKVIESLHLTRPVTIAELAELLEQKTVMPIVKSLYEKGLVMLHEELNEGYKPQKEIFVSHQFDVANKEYLQDVFTKLEAAPRQSDLLMAYLQEIKKAKPVTRKSLLKVTGASSSALQSLVDKGILSLYETETDRLPIYESQNQEYDLTTDQQTALDEIYEQFKTKNTVLLHGISGSGKTHIYMDLMDDALQQGKQALYLVPEIALTSQLIRRLRTRYGNDIGIYHSKFNPSERVEIWNKVLDGTYKIVLGVRSALFLPFKDLGLMVIDEEHEHSFKQFEPAPRYHARDTSIYLASLFGCKTILGSATPAFETFFNAKRNKYGYVPLNTRYYQVQPSDIETVDLREELKKKSMKSHFSSALYKEMGNTMATGGQVILFQNRRGYAPMLECTTCGWIPMCQNCDIALTYHQAAKNMVCHYCGYHEPLIKKCKACGNFTLKMLGFGTEKIEDELKIFFPDNVSLRMDQDSTRSKTAYTKIIAAIEDNEAQILIGTQMVTKGLDFENVRLVGILNADLLLKFPDFRALEHSYQLMAQVAGRAGRREIKGKVMIQTYNPQHPIFHFLLNHDYDGFYDHEIQERLDYKYPPFFKLIKIVLKDESLEKVKEVAHKLGDDLRDIFGHRLLGPEAPPVARIRNRYLMHILLKFERQNMNMAEAKKMIFNEITRYKLEKAWKTVRFIVDVDPY